MKVLPSGSHPIWPGSLSVRVGGRQRVQDDSAAKCASAFRILYPEMVL